MSKSEPLLSFMQTSPPPKERGRMLISKEKERYAEIDADKVSRGAFHTKLGSWLVQPVVDFINESLNSGFSGCLDPYAGAGDLLDACAGRFDCQTKGYDIVGEKWPINDSLSRIPPDDRFIIVTNPPYLAKYSAARKGVLAESAQYFNACAWDDLYQVALDRCLESFGRVVAIIPETFLNSSYPKKHVARISILEANPFHDTETPVCVVCFDREITDGDRTGRIYLGDDFRITLGELAAIRDEPSPKIPLRFNDASGTIAFKAVDGHSPDDRIRFMRADEFAYSADKIKVSSRLMTYIAIQDLPENRVDSLIEIANEDLRRIRNASCDLVLSPFKGNNKAGKRRRRLDYAMARKILARSVMASGFWPVGSGDLFSDQT